MKYIDFIQTAAGSVWHTREMRRNEHEWSLWSGYGKGRDELTADDLADAERINDEQCNRIEKELRNA